MASAAQAIFLYGILGTQLPNPDCDYVPTEPVLELRIPYAKMAENCGNKRAASCYGKTEQGLSFVVLPSDMSELTVGELRRHEYAHINCGDWHG